MKSIPKFIYKSAESTELQVIYNWDPVPNGVRYSLYPIFIIVVKIIINPMIVH